MDCTEERIYCPKCGALLKRLRGELTCVPGNMGLSQSLEQSLTERFGQDSAVLEPPVPRSVPIGGRWFCPFDGRQMTEVDGVVACPRCTRTLTGRQINHLIELHPHLLD
jgi:hypothetical protein